MLSDADNELLLDLRAAEAKPAGGGGQGRPLLPPAPLTFAFPLVSLTHAFCCRRVVKVLVRQILLKRKGIPVESVIEQ